MGRIVVFDLYDTLLKGQSFDFNCGVAYLHETYFKENVRWRKSLRFPNHFFSYTMHEK